MSQGDIARHVKALLEAGNAGEAAVAAYESAEYQKLIELRTPHSDMSVTITEELTDQ